MSAPTHEAATEQPTQPIPIEPGRITERSWLMSSTSLLLIPATILAAIGTGKLFRNYLLVTDIARSNFAIIVLVIVATVSVGVLLCARGHGRRERNFRAEDGQS